MRFVKMIIIVFWFLLSCWLVSVCFKRNFAHSSLVFSVDSWNEDVLMTIIHGAWQSCLIVFVCGMCALFSNFVFVRIAFNDEIRKHAMDVLRQKRSDRKLSKEQEEWIREQSLKNKTTVQKFLYNLKNWI